MLASNLVEAQGDEASPAAGRVRGLVNELTGYACTMIQLNPEVMHSFMSREQSEGSAASLQWRHILVCLSRTVLLCVLACGLCDVHQHALVCQFHLCMIGCSARSGCRGDW